jgi:hypothetical protein
MTINWPGPPLTAHDRSALPKNRSLLPKDGSLLPKNARLLPRPIGKSLKFEGTAQNRSLLPENARLAVGKNDQLWAVNSQI